STFSTFQSLTVHCARCHDHKFDPITQKDYYRLQAVFAGVERGNRPYRSPAGLGQRVTLEAQQKAMVARRDALMHKARAVTSPELARRGDEVRKLKEQLAVMPKFAGAARSPTNGYHSAIAPKPDVVKWVQVDLGRSLPLDEVRLIPARPTDFRDSPGFGFPV